MVNHRTADPLLCIPALHLAWKRPGAQLDYLELNSRDWIACHDFVSDDARLSKDTYPNFNASLGTKNTGLGLPEDVEGPQISWSGEEYGPTRETARRAFQAAWLREMKAKRITLRSRARQADTTYILDWIHSNDTSCIRSFHAYSNSQAAGLNVRQPTQITERGARVVSGWLRIPMGDGEFLILHNVKQCDSYTDNVIVVSHLLLASDWMATLDGGLISPR